MTTLGEAIDDFQKWASAEFRSDENIAKALRLRTETVICAKRNDDMSAALRAADVSLFQVQTLETDLDPALVAYVDKKFRQLQANLTLRGDTAEKLVNAALAEPLEILDDLGKRVTNIEVAAQGDLKTPENVQSMAACILAAMLGVTFTDATALLSRMDQSPGSWCNVAAAAIDELEASRIRNSGLRAEIDNLRAALAQAQTLIASGIHPP